MAPPFSSERRGALLADDPKLVGMFSAGLVERSARKRAFAAAAHGLRAYTEFSPWLSGNLAKAISMVSASTLSFLFLRFFVFRPPKGS